MSPRSSSNAPLPSSNILSDAGLHECLSVALNLFSPSPRTTLTRRTALARSSTSPPPPPPAPRPRTVIYHREHREQYRLATRSRPAFTIGPLPAPPPQRLSHKPVALQKPSPLFPAKNTPTMPRKISPLTPVRRPLPPRPSFHPSKPEPDLYRIALRTNMTYSLERNKILQMGPRLAMAILTATRELERIVYAAHDDDDVMVESSHWAPPHG